MSTERLSIERLQRIADVTWGELMRFCKPDACVLGVRVLKDVLAELGELDCEGLVVLAVCCNPPAAEHSRTHGCGALIGTCAERTDPMLVHVLGGDPTSVRFEGLHEFWAGHLVAIVKQRFMIDISISQASHPDKGLALEGTLVGKVPAEFVSGASSLDGGTETGLRIFYQAYPNAPPDWQQSSDWAWDSDLRRALVAGSVAKLMDEQYEYPEWLQAVQALAGRI